MEWESVFLCIMLRATQYIYRPKYVESKRPLLHTKQHYMKKVKVV